MVLNFILVVPRFAGMRSPSLGFQEVDNFSITFHKNSICLFVSMFHCTLCKFEQGNYWWEEKHISHIYYCCRASVAYCKYDGLFVSNVVYYIRLKHELFLVFDAHFNVKCILGMCCHFVKFRSIFFFEFLTWCCQFEWPVKTNLKEQFFTAPAKVTLTPNL